MMAQGRRRRASSTEAQCASVAATALLALLLPHACMAIVGVDEEASVVLKGSGPSELSIFLLRSTKALEDRIGRHVEILYRSLPSTAAARADFVAGKADFGVSVGPLPAASHAAVGGMLHVPIALHSVAFFFNVPGYVNLNTAGPSVPGTYLTLNMTACTVARILTGRLTKWDAPEITELNPSFKLIGSGTIKVIVDSMNSPATLAVDEFLSSPAGCPSVWTGAFADLPLGSDPDVPMLVMSTGHSIGYALTAAGNSVGLRMISLKNTDGAFVTPVANNITAARAALLSQLPTTFTSSFDKVSTFGLPGPGVYPALLADYLLVRTDQSSSGAKGTVLRAFSEMIVAEDMQALLQNISPDILVVGTDLASAAVASITSSVVMQTGQTPYTLEAPGAVNTTVRGDQVVSGNRASFETESINKIVSEMSAMEDRLSQNMPIVVRGSGSTAVQMVIWKLMNQFESMATSPVWMTYRPIGSSGGEAEFLGEKPDYAPATDFAISDFAMSTANWRALKNVGQQVVHLPLCVAPISFFFNWPKDKFPQQAIRMSSCTAAKVMQGDIKRWDDPAIAGDNPGVALPQQPILLAYRGTSVGPTAVISQYLAATCPEWKLGSGMLLDGWPESAYAARTASDMSSYIASTPYSIGYMDPGSGIGAGLSEVALKNKDGVWLTSVTSDMSAAASQLFQSVGWPSDPTDDFSKVSLIDQAGKATWPMSAMPYIIVRPDASSRGSSGILLRSFLIYYMSAPAQSLVRALHFGAIPAELLAYTQERTLPLLRVDTRQKDWTLELSAALKGGAGAGAHVVSSFKSTYNNIMMQQLIDAQAAAARKPVAAVSTGANLTADDMTNINKIGGLDSRVAQLEDKLKTYLALSIAAVTFGCISMGIGLYVGCRMFVAGVGAVAPAKGGGGMQSGMSFTGARGLSNAGNNPLMTAMSGDLSTRPSYTYGQQPPSAMKVPDPVVVVAATNGSPV